MIWIIRLFLLAYAVLYFGIGAWAIIDPVKDALELGYEIPSFMDAVGLKVSGVIGYSEVAGLYGGINMSGLVRTLGKRVRVYPLRGFESLSLRVEELYLFWRDGRADEGDSLENYCMYSIPWVRIPLPPQAWRGG